jgi:hypothetical protein
VRASLVFIAIVAVTIRKLVVRRNSAGERGYQIQSPDIGMETLPLRLSANRYKSLPSFLEQLA